MTAKSIDKYFGCMKLKPAAYVIVGIGLTISVAYLIMGISLLNINFADDASDDYADFTTEASEPRYKIDYYSIAIILMAVAGYEAVVNGLLWIGVYTQRTIFLRLWQLKTGASIVSEFVGIIVYLYLGEPAFAFYTAPLVVISCYFFYCIHTMCNQIQENYYRLKFNVSDDLDAVECQPNNKCLVFDIEQQYKRDKLSNYELKY